MCLSEWFASFSLFYASVFLFEAFFVGLRPFWPYIDPLINQQWLATILPICLCPCSEGRTEEAQNKSHHGQTMVDTIYCGEPIIDSPFVFLHCVGENARDCA